MIFLLSIKTKPFSVQVILSKTWFFLPFCLRIHKRLSTISKPSKKMYEVMLFEVWCICKSMNILKVYSISTHWDKTQILKQVSSDKISDTKNVLFFSLRAPTHHSFSFNIRFLYELKRKVRLSKTVCGIFRFKFDFVFIKVYFFVQQNTFTLWL